jgi:hypothetical protein
VLPVIVVTRLRWRDPAFFDEFFAAADAVGEQAKSSDGNLRADVLADANNTCWTRTSRQERGPMQAFEGTEPHLITMASLSGWCDEATFVDWVQSSPDLPDWQVASRVLAHFRIRLGPGATCRTADMRAASAKVIGGKGNRNEAPLARKLVPLLREGMLLLADRAYDAAGLLAAIAATGAHLLARGSASRKPAVLNVLPDRSYLSQIDGLKVRIIHADLDVTGADRRLVGCSGGYLHRRGVAAPPRYSRAARPATLATSGQVGLQNSRMASSSSWSPVSQLSKNAATMSSSHRSR